MPVLRRRLAAITVAALLAAPTTALGQSAGDDQYEDPFAGDEQGQTQQPAATPEPAAPAPEPAPAEPAPAEPAAESTPVPPALAPAPGAEPVELPRTGLDAGPVLAIGTALVAGGVLLRLRVRERT